MHRAITVISKRVTQIRPGEGRKVLLTFTYFFLVITAYYVIKPVSRSLVLDDLGSRMVPYVDLWSALLMGPMVALFARLADRLDKRRLIGLTFWAVAANLLLFWKLLHWSHPWVAAVFYVWVAVFSVLVVTMFWLVTNDLYHQRDAKRLFGFIGSGGILGGIVGSSIAAAGAHLVGTANLLLISAGILLGCWLVVERLWRYGSTARPVGHDDDTRKRPSPRDRASTGVLGLLLRSRYLVLLVVLVGIAKIVSTLIYYQFNPFIEQMFPGQDAKTAFTGAFFGWMSVAAFVVQFFCTSWLLRRAGLTVSLLILPVGLLGGSLGLLLIPMFWLAAAAELYDGSLNYSLQQTTKEVLYLPINRTVRYKIKPFIDMVVFRLGKGIAAVIGILMLDVWQLDAWLLGYVTVPLVSLWLLAALQLRRDYVAAIYDVLRGRIAARRSTRSPAEDLAHEETATTDEHDGLAHWSEPHTPHHAAYQKLVLAGHVLTVEGVTANGGRQLLDALVRYEQRPPPVLPSVSSVPIERLKTCIQDPHEPMVVRRAAAVQLAQRGDQEAVDCLLGMLMVEQDAAMRQELIRGLVTLRMRAVRRGLALEFPKRVIRRQIAKEVQIYQRLKTIAGLYARRASGATRGVVDPMTELLRVCLGDAIQQIFQLLALICRPQDIVLVYTQMQAVEPYVRADAIELLDNLLDPGLRWLVFPVLDEDRFLESATSVEADELANERKAVQILQESINDHHQWGRILSLWVVGRLSIEPLLPELDRAARSPEPIVSLAARVGRYFAAESALRS